jgi:hypothetical protein
MTLGLIILLLFNLNNEEKSEWNTIQFWTIAELTTSPIIIEGKVTKIDSQYISIAVTDVLKGKVKTKQIKLANNFYTNYALERRSDKGLGFWKIGEERVFFIRKAFYEDELIQKNIFRTFHRHNDSERKIINIDGEKSIELSYGNWINSALNKKYEDLKDLNNAHRKRILYSYPEMKEAIRYFSSNKNRIQRKVRRNINKQQSSKKVERKWRLPNWNGVISNKKLIKLSEKNPSFERLLDEYFDNVYKRTW